MPSNPANFQRIVPVAISVSAQRFGITRWELGPILTWDGGLLDFDPATTFELWVSPADPAQAVPVFITQLSPLIPLEWTPGGAAPYHNSVFITLCKDDFDTLGAYAGPFSYQLLCSKDGGTTVDQVGQGVITVGQFLTTSW